MDATKNTYLRHPRLVNGGLVTLVRDQRTLAAKLAAVAMHIEPEKTLRAAIDVLLLAEGFTSNEGVTCSGYDVKHHERKGQTSYDVVLLGTALVDKLVELGMPRADAGDPAIPATFVPGAETFVVTAIAAVRSVGDPSLYASVAPMKGAKVRT